MSDLTQDETTLLLIAANGEPMMPIGRWRASAENLVAKGYLKPRPHAGDPTGFFNLHITAAGQAAVDASEQQTAVTMTMITSDIERQHEKLRGEAEAIAVSMANLAERSAQVTGENARASMQKWAKVIGKRALELVR